jgi:uncharacterized protein YecT (DUF1311 family)
MKLAGRLLVVLASVGVVVPSARASTDVEGCLQAAATQSEMSRCAGVAYADARRELDRVLGKIRTLYAGNADFIAALGVSQDAWQRSVDADLEMLYPGPDKQGQYGSVYGMCAGLDKLSMTLARIEFLKKWLNGNEEGDVCGGSIVNKYCLDHDCSSPGMPLKSGN